MGTLCLLLALSTPLGKSLQNTTGKMSKGVLHWKRTAALLVFMSYPFSGPLLTSKLTHLPHSFPHVSLILSSLPFPFTIFIVFIPLSLHPAVLLPSLGSAPFHPPHCQTHSTPQAPLPTASHTERISDGIQNLS